MLNKIKRLFGWRDEQYEHLETPKDVDASFELCYDELLVGRLDLHAGDWVFAYSDAFKQQQEVRPLVDFPDKDRTYRSDALWPFFLSRIPSVAQPRVQHVIQDEGIDPKSDVQLLKRFGERSISNPFVLIESHHAA